MNYRDETEEEHRARDEKTWDTIFLIGLIFKGSRWWILLLLAVVCAIWAINILGDSTALNNPNIYYAGKDSVTGKPVAIKGCRPDRLQLDGTCDKSIDWSDARKSFPFFGPAKQIPTH